MRIYSAFDGGSRDPTERLIMSTRFGAVGVFGRTNAGKSTLVNAMVGEKVSIVSPKVQTTRKRVMGILTVGTDQVVFCDTPGLHPLKNRLDAFMMGEIESTISGLNGALFLVDASDPDPEADQDFLKLLSTRRKMPMCLVINKKELVSPEKLAKIQQAYAHCWPFSQTFPVSALRTVTLKDLLKHILEWLPEGMHGYQADDFTTSPEREIVSEVIREAILNRYYHEIPHSIAVVVEEFKERPNGKTFISANLYLEREGQKKILIGQGGEGIRELGSTARKKLNQLLRRDIFLELWVKVKPNWRKHDEWIKRFGFSNS